MRSDTSNLGAQTIHFATDDGSEASAAFRATDVSLPLASAAANEDIGAASSELEEHAAMMFGKARSAYQDWSNHSRLQEIADSFCQRAEKAADEYLTPDPMEKYHKEKGTTSLRDVCELSLLMPTKEYWPLLTKLRTPTPTAINGRAPQ